jgi:hypothetical protein
MDFFHAFFIIVCAAGLSIFITRKLLIQWFTIRLEQSIKHEYDRKLESFKFEMRKREQAEIVADLFSQWIIIKDTTIPNARVLNKLSLEMSLWLPDEVALEVNKTLKLLKDSKPVQELIIECRKIIHGGKTELKPGDITFFGT